MRVANRPPGFDGEPLDGPIVARGYDPSQARCNPWKETAGFARDSGFRRGRSLACKPSRWAVRPPPVVRGLFTFPALTGDPPADEKSDLFDIWAVTYAIVWHIKPAYDAVLSASKHGRNAGYFTIQPDICRLCKALFQGLELSSTTGLVALMYLFRLKISATEQHYGWTDVRDDELATTVIYLADVWVNDLSYEPISYANFTGIPLRRLLELKRRALFALGFDLHVSDEELAAFKTIVDNDLRAFQVERDAFVRALSACMAVNANGGQSGRRDSGCSVSPKIPDSEIIRPAAEVEWMASNPRQAAQTPDAQERLLRDAESVQREIQAHQSWIQHERLVWDNIFQRKRAAQRLNAVSCRQSEANYPRMTDFVGGAYRHRPPHPADVAAEIGKQGRPPLDTRKIWTDDLRRAFDPAPYVRRPHAKEPELEPTVIPMARGISATLREHPVTMWPPAFAKPAAESFRGNHAARQRHAIGDDQTWLCGKGMTYTMPAPIPYETGYRAAEPEFQPPVSRPPGINVSRGMFASEMKRPAAFAVPAAGCSRGNYAPRHHALRQDRAINDERIWLSGTGTTYGTLADVGCAVSAATTKGVSHQPPFNRFQHFIPATTFDPWSAGRGANFKQPFYGQLQPRPFDPWDCGMHISTANRW